MEMTEKFMMNGLRWLCFCVPALFIWSAQAQVAGVEYNWEEQRDRKGIKIFTSTVAGSQFRAVRGEMKIAGSVSALVGLVNDLPNCQVWADLCKSSKFVEQMPELPNEQYVHIYNDIPFPVKDRDVVAHLVWEKNNNTGRVSMHSTALSAEKGEELVAITSKAIRITNAFSQWHFTPLESGRVLVESFAHIDPNGATPAWITNMLLVDSPYKTMVNMRNIIEAGQYSDAVNRFAGEKL